MDTYTYDGKTLRATEKAIQFRVYMPDGTDRDIWLPLSQITRDVRYTGEGSRRGHVPTVTMPEWLAREKGLPVKTKSLGNLEAARKRLGRIEELVNAPGAGETEADRVACEVLNEEAEDIRALLNQNQTIKAAETLPGTYTVVLEDGSHRTIKILDHGFQDGDNKLIVKYLFGPDNTADYVGFAHIDLSRYDRATGKGIYFWQAFKANPDNAVCHAASFLMTADENGRHEFGKEYARRSGNCYVCNRTLTTPESIAAGIGPVCGGRVGISLAA